VNGQETGREIMEKERRRIRTLAVFHYVFAGIILLVACFPLIHLFMGLSLLSGRFHAYSAGNPQTIIGWIFVAVSSGMILFGWILAIPIFLSGRRLASLQSRNFCLVVGAMECILVPLGTILGGVTLVTLSRESAKSLFGS